MTNLFFSIVLSLSTNWTGVSEGTNELGYVVTNHYTQVVYQNRTNEFLLLSQPSNIAVWRPVVWARIGNGALLTNYLKMPDQFIPLSNYWLLDGHPTSR